MQQPDPASDPSLSQAVAHAFSAQGALAQGQSHYESRQAQLEMAQSVAEAIETRQALVVEAGTGTGKTFAYLVPILLSGQRAIISTASKALQDQLFHRDLPAILKALALPSQTALLKGRSNYLCLWRMQQARSQGHGLSASQLSQLAQIERWAKRTSKGDFAELGGLSEAASVLPWVSSTRENCLGQDCPLYNDCHVMQARSAALEADVVVINHHLFFADLAIKQEGFGQLLPHNEVVVLDEAHQLNEIGVQFLGQRLASSQLLDFCRDCLAGGLSKAQGQIDWQDLIGTLEFATREQRLTISEHWRKEQGASRIRWLQVAPEGIEAEPWCSGLEDIEAALQALEAGLDTVADIDPELRRLHERAQELLVQLQFFQQAPKGEGVRWLEVAQHWLMVHAPLDIALAMRQQMQPPPPTPLEAASTEPDADTDAETLPMLPDLDALGDFDESDSEAGDAAEAAASPWLPRTWVFTSATLGDANNLNWFTMPCGLSDAPQLRLPSPFNYPEQAALYIPENLPHPQEGEAHSLAVAKWAAASARILGGKTLVLTTTHRALQCIAKDLKERLALDPIEILVQGDAGKNELIAALRQGKRSEQHTGSVLVATSSLWEGIDIPGDALQLVIIDKLPFPPPDDPVVMARSERLKAAGLEPFPHQTLPEAAVMLKQGAGRLIRSQSDRGLLLICDPRLASSRYGPGLVRALPPMRRLQSPAEYRAAIEALAAAAPAP